MPQTTSFASADFDHRDEESRDDPYPRWREMREKTPLAFSEKHGGFYVLSRYSDICEVGRNTELYSTVLKRTTIPLRATPASPPLNADPPDHRLYRAILNPYFSPAQVATYESWIREIASDIIDPLLHSDAFDAVTDLGLALTRAAILRILGMRDAPLEVHEWVDDLVVVGGERGEVAGAKLMQFLSEEVARRQQSLGGDVVSAILTSTFEGRPLRLEDEVLPMTLLLLVAGLETTASAIAVSVLYLLDHPEQRVRLMAEPEIWDHAIDELLRWITPVPAQSRTLRHDGEVLGCPIPAGERVMMLFGSGNRDEREFPDPDKVVLDRRPNRHLSFGMGPHRCIGSHLAKCEMKIALQLLLPELDNWQVSDSEKPVWKAAETRGLSHLPLVRKSR